MSDSFSDKILSNEYDRMCVEIRAIESNNEKAIAFGLSLITATFAVGIAQHVHIFFFVIPIALVGVFFYAALMYSYVFSMGGYKAYLEDRINEKVGKNLLLWERLVKMRQKRNIIRPALIGIYLFIGFMLGGVSEFDISTNYGFRWAIAEACCVVILLCILLVALRRMWKMHDWVYEQATIRFKSEHLEVDGGHHLDSIGM